MTNEGKISPGALYRVNGRFNPLAEDKYILHDFPKGRVYDEASLYSPNNLSYENEMSDSSNGYEKARYIPSNFHRSVSINNADEAGIPLLNGGEGMGGFPSEGNDYCKEPFPETNTNAWKKLLAATTMCLLFMILELVGGYIAGSLAVMTDAAHLLSDCVGFLISLFAVWVAGQPPTKRFTFGYHRAEVLGALLSISVVWILTGIFIYLAITRLVRSDFNIHADAMLIVSAMGIGINIVMGCILHGGNFSHFHSHDQNINVRAAVIHVFGDLIQSIGVFISACVINFYPKAKIIDPLCTFLCCILVILSTSSVLRQSVWILLETVPPHLDYTVLYDSLISLDGVDSVHALHVWALTPGQYVASAHISVGALTDRDLVLERAQKLLRTKFCLDRVTIQVERHTADILAQ